MRLKFDQLKELGKDLAEYSFILVLIAMIVVVLVLNFQRSKVNGLFSRIGSGLS